MEESGYLEAKSQITLDFYGIAVSPTPFGGSKGQFLK
jgi:hypothetical protein